jgi:glycerol-3-phosphate dehydrogenase
MGNNSVTVVTTMLLKEAYNISHAALCEKFTEANDCSLIHDLLCTCTSKQRRKKSV